MESILSKIENSHTATKEELTMLLTSSDFDEEIFKAADRVREKYLGNEVHLRGLVEFSNVCKCQCKYCGLRAQNDKLERYTLNPDEVIDLVKKAVSYGYKTIVMQSGENCVYKHSEMVDLIRKVKEYDVALTLSIGEKTYQEYKDYKEAGADRFLLRIETTDEELYKKMHPGMSLENRFKCLENIKELGLEVGTGCLVGLPGQTMESLANDILFFKELGADMVGIGPFIPNPNTPLADEKVGDFNLALKVMALTRLLLPDINIPATTAMETLDPKGRIIALQSGANVVMPNVTEGDYRRKYEIYPGKICINDTPAHCRGCISGKIASIGRTVATSKGNSKHFKR